MAWVTVKVEAGSGEWVAQMSSTSSNPVFSMPFGAAIVAGDSFTADGKAYTCVNSVDLAQRGETLLVEAKESKNDKPLKGRNGNNSGGKDVHDTPVD